MSQSGLIEQERYTCAIGALQSVVAIPRAVPILHSGPGCGTMISGFYERSTGYAGGSTSPCTNFSETEVVFGGVERLRNIIENTYKVLDTDLQVVLTGCTADIVGDDVGSIASEFVAQGRPLVYVETAGFKSNNYVSHSSIVNAIIDQFVDLTVEDFLPRSNKKLVNLFASIPYQDPFWKGNLAEYKRLLTAVGFEVNVLFGPQSGGVYEWQTIPSANFNILVSPWYGLPIVEHLEQKYGQPFFQFPHVPIGANQTTAFLTQLLDFANSLQSHPTKSGFGGDPASPRDGAAVGEQTPPLSSPRSGVAAGEERSDERNAGDPQQPQKPLIDPETFKQLIQQSEYAYYEEIDNLATFLLEFRYGLPNHVHILHDAGYVVGLSKFLLHEVGIVPVEQFIVDNTPEEFQAAIKANLDATSDKRQIPVLFDPDAGAAQKVIRNATHQGRGIILGSGWDKELAKEKDYDFLSIAAPSPYRLVMTTNYVGYSGGLRVIEDIYDVVLSSYA
jgi:nitrogenase molybdenum-iron protein beta chain